MLFVRCHCATGMVTEFRNHYVGASVEGLSETQIEEYLDDHGLKRLHDSAPASVVRPSLSPIPTACAFLPPPLWSVLGALRQALACAASLCHR